MKKENVQPLEYLATAYDSTRPRELAPPMVDNERSMLARSWLKHKLDPVTVECGEFLCLSGSGDMDELRSGELDERAKDYPLQILWSSFKNPFVWIDSLRGAAGFFAIVSALGFILVAVIALIVGGEGGNNLMHGANLLAVIGLVSAVVYYSFGELVTLEKNPSDNSYVFNRLTGMVHLPREGGQSKAIPFDEFAPYLHKVISPNGFTTYNLILGHKYSNLHLLHQGVHQNPKQVYLQWEFQRQFMDVSQPLPDVPGLEPLRQYDPATIEWDKRMGRPPDFWRNFPDESYYELLMVAEKAVKAFPWGAKRQHALYVGWSPTCFSEMTWRGILEPGSDDEKASHWQRCLSLAEDKQERERNVREKRFWRLISLIDATFEARKLTLEMARRVVANYKLSSEDKEKFITYIENTESSLGVLAASRYSFRNAGPSGSISGQDSDPVYLHDEWIKEIGNQATTRQIMVDYEYPGDLVKQRTEHVLINYEAIIAATDTLKLWETTRGEIAPLGIQDTLVAFLVDLVAENGQLDGGEVIRLNRMLGQELTAEKYINRYSEKLDNDQAIKNFVSLLVLLGGYSNKLLSFVVKQTQLLIEDIVEADGVYNEYEWHRISIYREHLGKALGLEFSPPNKPGEVPA